MQESSKLQLIRLRIEQLGKKYDTATIAKLLLAMNKLFISKEETQNSPVSPLTQ